MCVCACVCVLLWVVFGVSKLYLLFAQDNGGKGVEGHGVELYFHGCSFMGEFL